MGEGGRERDRGREGGTEGEGGTEERKEGGREESEFIILLIFLS